MPLGIVCSPESSAVSSQAEEFCAPDLWAHQGMSLVPTTCVSEGFCGWPSCRVFT